MGRGLQLRPVHPSTSQRRGRHRCRDPQGTRFPEERPRGPLALCRLCCHHGSIGNPSTFADAIASLTGVGGRVAEACRDPHRHHAGANLQADMRLAGPQRADHGDDCIYDSLGGSIMGSTQTQRAEVATRPLRPKPRAGWGMVHLGRCLHINGDLATVCRRSPSAPKLKGKAPCQTFNLPVSPSPHPTVAMSTSLMPATQRAPGPWI